MRTFDELLSRIITFSILSFIVCIIPNFIELNTQNSTIFLVLLNLIMFGGLFLIIYYIIQLMGEKKEISDMLNDMKSDGMKIYQEKYEILLYSRDIADIPKIANIAFNFNALAIIQPKSIEEIKKVLLLCKKYEIPLIPRGAGTSGYGGVLPVNQGIVLVLTHFNSILSLNTDKLTVEVEAGITWNRLREFLIPKGYDLLLYPSSAPSSTVGGWIASGGYGVGSSRYGEVNNSVLSASLLISNGKEVVLNEPKEFIGNFGVQGIFNKVILKIRPDEPLIHIAIYSNTFQDVQTALVNLQEKNPYFLRFIDQKNIRWVNEEIQNHLKEKDSDIAGIISASYLKSDLQSSLESELNNEYTSAILPNEFASELWNDRFYTLKLKRGGPSLIISEVLIPTAKLSDFHSSLNNSFQSDHFTVEIVSTNTNVSVVMVWFPTDQRVRNLPIVGSIPYLLRWFRTFHVIRLATKVGGSTYHNGGFWLNAFPKRGNKLLIKRILRSKAKYDPSNIFNPNKLVSGRIPRFFPFLSWAFGLKLCVPILDRFYSLLPKKMR